MNILLTNSCNRKCPYCFAQERVSYTNLEDFSASKSRGAPVRISREDFRYALDFARKSEQKMVGILGGEPSVHPQFIELLKDAWAAGIITTIFTNGMWKNRVIDQFSACASEEKKLARIVVNVNEPRITSKKERSSQENLLSKIGPHCALSFNIYHKDFDPLFLTDIIDRYNCRRHIRLGVAVPLANQESEYLDIEHYPEAAKVIMKLAKRCDQRDISLGFDCGFILCMFSERDIGRLQLYGAQFKSTCGSIIDIGTDLSVWSCFPLSTFAQGYSLADYRTIDELDGSFRKQFARLYNAGALNECVDCRFRRRKQCSGGCAAHVYRRLNS